MKNEELAQHATHVRQNIVKMLTKAGSGHPGDLFPSRISCRSSILKPCMSILKIRKKLIETASFFQKVIAHRPYMQRL